MMSIGFKRLLAITATTAVALGMTACGSANEENTSTANTSDGDIAEITFLHRIMDKDNAKTVNELVEEFNAEHPGIKVTAETMQGSASESYAKINSIVQGGKDVPCIAELGSERVPDMLGVLMDVTEYAEKYEDSFIPAFFEKAKVGDTVYGLPHDASPLVMFYRKDILEEYGISVPVTWDEFEDAAHVIRDKSDGNSYISSFITDDQLWLSSLTSSEGADWFGYDAENQAWSVMIDSPETRKVADYWQGLLDNDLVLLTQRWGQDFPSFLADGTIAAHLGGSWEAAHILKAAPELKDKWAVAQIPHFDSTNTSIGQNGGTTNGILQGCEYPEESVEFLHWWASNVEGLTGLGLFPVVRVDTIETPEQYKDYFDGQEIYEEFITANNNAATTHWAPQVSEILRVIGDEEGNLEDGANLRDVFEKGQQAAGEILTSVGLTVQ